MHQRTAAPNACLNLPAPSLPRLPPPFVNSIACVPTHSAALATGNHMCTGAAGSPSRSTSASWSRATGWATGSRWVTLECQEAAMGQLPSRCMEAVMGKMGTAAERKSWHACSEPKRCRACWTRICPAPGVGLLQLSQHPAHAQVVRWVRRFPFHFLSGEATLSRGGVTRVYTCGWQNPQNPEHRTQNIGGKRAKGRCAPLRHRTQNTEPRKPPLPLPLPVRWGHAWKAARGPARGGASHPSSN